MRTLIGNAIVIDKRDYKEADIKVLLSTDKYGHIYVIAPNAKKSKRRFVGGLNLFSLLEFSVDKKGELFVLNESTLISENEVAFDSIENFLSASSIIEIAEKLYTLNNPEETAFYKLRHSLEHLPKGNGLYMIFDFLWSSTIEIGEGPEFHNCVICLSNIKSNKILFNYYRGGIVCGECMKKDNRGENISQDLYKFLASYNDEFIRPSKNMVRQGLFLLERYLRFKLGIKLNSFRFL